VTPAGITILLPERILVVHTLLLDLNGTVAIDGHLLPGVAERVQRLSAQLRVIVASGDTFGTAEAVARQLDVERRQLEPTDQGSQKAALVEELGAAGAVVIGNGANDAEALRAAALGVCVIGPEGAARDAMLAADVMVADPLAALDLLLEPLRLVGTLRR
jgi:P-type E1-E2 ATPase